MRLVDLSPSWCIDADIVIGGVKRQSRLVVWFANPIDGSPPTDDASHLWQRTGETFETLSLSPSVDASKYGHWHGYITNGEVK